jgi:uncharacterized protein with HEPN domain
MPREISQRDKNVIVSIITLCNFFIDHREKFSKENLHQDEFVLNTACYKIVNIGEEVGRLSEETLTNTRTVVDWHKVRGMRNRLAHAYLEVDIDILHKTITDFIPKLHKALEKLV